LPAFVLVEVGKLVEYVGGMHLFYGSDEKINLWGSRSSNTSKTFTVGEHASA
jgi:hypothetical protein